MTTTTDTPTPWHSSDAGSATGPTRRTPSSPSAWPSAAASTAGPASAGPSSPSSSPQ
ncbi:hypothetical protein ACFQ0M_48245 [Kitasatospora aburaviensis]